MLKNWRYSVSMYRFRPNFRRRKRRSFYYLEIRFPACSVQPIHFFPFFRMSRVRFDCTACSAAELQSSKLSSVVREAKAAAVAATAATDRSWKEKVMGSSWTDIGGDWKSHAGNEIYAPLCRFSTLLSDFTYPPPPFFAISFIFTLTSTGWCSRGEIRS